MSSLISSHLMNCIMDCVKSEFFSFFSKSHLSCCSTALGIYTHLNADRNANRRFLRQY